MHKDLNKKIQSSFLSCEKDAQTILQKLFITNPEKNNLTRLLVINTKDCIDDYENEVYKAKVASMTLPQLMKEGYITLTPKVKLAEHEEVKSYIIISFDNFVTNANNPQFRDCMVSFDIICNSDYWDIGNCRMRPLKIAGYIDGVLNNARLSGIGTFQFLGCNELILNEHLSGYTLTYMAIHGGDDKVEND